jgi:mannose/fructose-specific phosphotransferase system component IIA
MVYAIIVGQGQLPQAMLEAARAIVPDVDGVSSLSNVECPVGKLRTRLEQAIMALPDGGDVIVFADMFGSSCANAGLEVKRRHSRVAVLSGVNLSMIVRFLCHRNRKPFAELVPFLVETGRGAVQAIEL